ncbi:toxin C-terminal domain-containing protein [Moraxella sp.]|uniref:toxin C-terminal domain-containing protein n=1 Tax=Moraxella sp. TaxID=479 RepID=UPI0026DA93CD|nr:toxin C-terminal domain-containing protein [Moraxella sp.]MDO4894243.1 toxin C-terminal domain-containing protein [Moraxella sp.]
MFKKTLLSIMIGVVIATMPTISFAGKPSKGGKQTTTTAVANSQQQTPSKNATTTPARATSGPVFKNDTEAAKAAAALGYTKTNLRSSGDTIIFKKGNSYITRDRTGHKGGAWKEASSPEKLNRKETRNGTFDINMNRVDD